MWTKWYDAAVQVVAFDELSTGDAEKTGRHFRAHAIHIFSLMSACTLIELKKKVSTKGSPFSRHPNAATEGEIGARGRLKDKRVCPVLCGAKWKGFGVACLSPAGVPPIV